VRDLTRPLGEHMTVTVFCGAAHAPAPYMTAARDLGRLLAERDIHVVYGGGRLGLMGAMADAALTAGGQVTGILPHCLNVPGVVHPDLTDLRVVDDMNARKADLIGQADAVIALPGGFGTLDEIAYLWAAIAFGAPARPLGLVNTLGFFDPLLHLVQNAAAEGFLDHHLDLLQHDLFLHGATPRDVLAVVIPRTRPGAEPGRATR
jgi:uncharacterized protein (TIGR00730 family)